MGIGVVDGEIDGFDIGGFEPHQQIGFFKFNALSESVQSAGDIGLSFLVKMSVLDDQNHFRVRLFRNRNRVNGGKRSERGLNPFRNNFVGHPHFDFVREFTADLKVTQRP